MDIITIAVFGGVIWLIIRHIKKTFTIYVDSRGYERNGYHKLIHRTVAFRELYDHPNTHILRFGEYDVHHIDRNKKNNSPENLQILTREQHKVKHGF